MSAEIEPCKQGDFGGKALQFNGQWRKIKRPGLVLEAPGPSLTEGDLSRRSHMTAASRSMPESLAHAIRTIGERRGAA